MRNNILRTFSFITGTAFVADAICGVLVNAIAACPEVFHKLPERNFLKMLSGTLAGEPLYAVPMMIMNVVCAAVGTGMVLYGAKAGKRNGKTLLGIFPVLGIIAALFRPFTPFLGPSRDILFMFFAFIRAAAGTACCTVLAVKAADIMEKQSKRQKSL